MDNENYHFNDDSGSGWESRDYLGGGSYSFSENYHFEFSKGYDNRNDLEKNYLSNDQIDRGADDLSGTLDVLSRYLFSGLRLQEYELYRKIALGSLEAHEENPVDWAVDFSVNMAISSLAEAAAQRVGATMAMSLLTTESVSLLFGLSIGSAVAVELAVIWGAGFAYREIKNSKIIEDHFIPAYRDLERSISNLYLQESNFNMNGYSW